MISTLIWTALAAMTEGTISTRIRLIPGSPQWKSGRNRNPTRRRLGSWTANCRNPPTRVPTDNPMRAFCPKPGSISQPKNAPPTIEPTLKKLDAIAGAAKTFREFSIPMTSAASETSRMNGYMICVSTIVKAASCGANPGASTLINSLAKTMPSRLTKLMKTAASVIIFEASTHAEASPSFWILCEKTVTNAVERAPSANRSRRRFGARNAIRNSPIDAVPKSELKRTSRTRPSTRLHITATAMIPLALVLSFSLIAPTPCAGAP